MARLYVTATLVLSVVAVAFAGEAVLTLTGENFDSTLADTHHILVEFFAPWCGHCKKLAPEYEEAALALQESGSLAKIAKVDCTEESSKAVCESQKVNGYPTLKWFDNGEESDYEGPRTKDGIVTFVKRFSGPVLTEISTAAEVKSFAKDNGATVVAFLKPGSKNKDLVKSIAEKMRSDASFVVAPHSILAEVDSKSASHAAPVILFFTPIEEEPIRFTGELNEAELKKFIISESFPLIQEISPGNYKSYVDRKLPIVWVFLEKEGRDANVEILRATAAASKGKLSWVWLDSTDYARHAENMGLGDKWPGVIVDDQVAKLKYRFPADSKFSEKALTKWAANVLSGDAEPFVKSEDIPEDNAGPLTKVVGKNYQSIVLDEEKDVLLEFYAPWCGHCQQLAPKYKALADIFQEDKSVVVAQVDATLNDLPLDVKGFPTIFFFPGGKKSSPMEYSGDRSMSALAKYIAEHSTTLSAERKKSIEALPDVDEEPAADDDSEGGEEEPEEEREEEPEEDEEKAEL